MLRLLAGVLRCSACALQAQSGQVVRAEHGDVVVDCRPWIRSGHSITQVWAAAVRCNGT